MGWFDEVTYGLTLPYIHREASFRERDFLNGKKTIDANRLIAALTEHVQRLDAELSALREQVEAQA